MMPQVRAPRAIFASGMTVMSRRDAIAARVVQEYAARPCMTLRGAKAAGAVMVTSHLTGHSVTTPPPARN